MVLDILAFAVVATWQAYVATVQRGIATAQRNTALSRLRAVQSLKSATDPLSHLDLALLQSVAAYRIQPTAECAAQPRQRPHGDEPREEVRPRVGYACEPRAQS